MPGVSSILTALNPVALGSAAAEAVSNPGAIASAAANASLSRDLDTALTHMLLPEDVFKVIESPMCELGFPLEKRDVYDVLQRRVEHYHTQTDYGAIALLHVQPWVMEDSKNVLSVSSISDPFIGYGGLFIFSLIDVVPTAYDRMIEQWCEKKSFKSASCVIKKNLKDLESFDPEARKEELRRLLKLKVPPPPGPLSLDDETKQKIADILIPLVGTSSTKDFLKRLLLPVSLPKDWKDSRIQTASADAMIAVWELLDAAIAQGENKNRPGYTVLGSILEEAANKLVGQSERTFLEETITKFGLVHKAK
jgi:Arc/MetJ-type ribon-helix-helix transcriptional regulator